MEGVTCAKVSPVTPLLSPVCTCDMGCDMSQAVTWVSGVTEHVTILHCNILDGLFYVSGVSHKELINILSQAWLS